MAVSGSFAFSISDKKLDFRFIEQNISIVPTKTIRRSQMVGKLNNIEAPYDIWLYEVELRNSDKNLFELTQLLDDFLPFKSFIQVVSKKYESVKISAYIRSEYGQMEF